MNYDPQKFVLEFEDLDFKGWFADSSYDTLAEAETALLEFRRRYFAGELEIHIYELGRVRIAFYIEASAHVVTQIVTFTYYFNEDGSVYSISRQIEPDGQYPRG